MIEIDGSTAEGGGQLLRCAVALSSITGKETRIYNIRANRPTPGLAPQHLAAIAGVASLSGGKVEGARAGSTDIIFKPGKVHGGRHRLDVGTAGSVTLVLQACMLSALRSESPITIEVIGGTNVKWSPPVDYYDLVLLPLLGKMDLDARISVTARGFYPEGGGRVELEIAPPTRFRPLDLRERGRALGVRGVCFSQNLPDHVCKRISHSAKKSLVEHGRVEIGCETLRGVSTGAGICLSASFDNTVLGADALGERGLPAEKVGEVAASALKEEMSGPGTLDVHSADQILPYMALAGGPSSFKVRKMTKHLETQMWLVDRFIDAAFAVKDIPGGHQIEIRPSHT